MFKAKGPGELLVFVRHKLWTVVCEAAERNTVACKVGFSEIDDGGWQGFDKFVQLVEVIGSGPLFVPKHKYVLRNKVAMEVLEWLKLVSGIYKKCAYLLIRYTVYQ